MRAVCVVVVSPGGVSTGKSPVDRGESGWKWSLLCDRAGIPVSCSGGGADRNDQALLAPTLAAAGRRGLLFGVEMLHLDRGYAGDPVRRVCESYGIHDVTRAPKRAPGTARGRPKPVPPAQRWTIERTNSWLSNFGQLRRSTDRNTKARLGQPAPAIAATPPSNSSNGPTDGTQHNRQFARALRVRVQQSLSVPVVEVGGDAASPVVKYIVKYEYVVESSRHAVRRGSRAHTA